MFDQVVKEFNDSISQIVVLPPAVSQRLEFVKLENAKGWGYEAGWTSNALVPGNYIISYTMECPDATYVLSSTEAWQFDGNHNSMDYVGEGNRFNYKKIDGNKILIETPINIKPNVNKVVVRVTKFNQKKKPELKIENAQIRSVF